MAVREAVQRGAVTSEANTAVQLINDSLSRALIAQWGSYWTNFGNFANWANWGNFNQWGNAY